MFDGKSIKKKRTEAGVKQKDFAKKLKISVAYLSNIKAGRKKPSVELKEKIDFFLQKYTTSYGKEKQYTKNQLKEYEKEILETYDLMRMDENPYAKIATIKRALIEINEVVEKNFLILEIALEPRNPKILKRVERPLKTTLKNLEKNREKIEKFLVKETIVIEEE